MARWIEFVKYGWIPLYDSTVRLSTACIFGGVWDE